VLKIYKTYELESIKIAKFVLVFIQNEVQSNIVICQKHLCFIKYCFFTERNLCFDVFSSSFQIVTLTKNSIFHLFSLVNFTVLLHIEIPDVMKGCRCH